MGQYPYAGAGQHVTAVSVAVADNTFVLEQAAVYPSGHNPGEKYCAVDVAT